MDFFSSGFVLKHLYIHTNAFTCRNPKTVSLSTAIKVNAPLVGITKASPIAAPFVCSSIPVSLFSSAVCRQTMKIFAVFHSPGLQLSERINIHFIAGENPMALIFSSRRTCISLLLILFFI